jgi:restriction endonuclease Mrr
MENQTKDALIARIKALALEYKTLRVAPFGKPKNQGAQDAGETVKAPAKAESIDDYEVKARAKIEAAIADVQAQLAKEKTAYEAKIAAVTKEIEEFESTHQILVESEVNGIKGLVFVDDIKDQIRVLINKHNALTTQWVSYIFVEITLSSKEETKSHIFNNNFLYKGSKLEVREDNIYDNYYSENVHKLALKHVADLKDCRSTFSKNNEKKITVLKNILAGKIDPTLIVPAKK